MQQKIAAERNYNAGLFSKCIMVLILSIGLTGCFGDKKENTPEEVVSFTVTATAGAGGSISPGSRTVQRGQTTSFTLTPDAGYGIGSVTGCNGSLSGATYTTGAITADCKVQASFNLNSYTVTATAGEGGSVTPSQLNISHGSTAEFIVAAHDYFKIDSVTGCEGQLLQNKFKLSPVHSPCTLEVKFAADIKTGAILTQSLTGPAVVGRDYQSLVRIVLNDSRNRITALELTNLTSGGAAPKISPEGDVYWRPADIDFAATKSLKLEAKFEHGEPFRTDIPVTVFKERIVLNVDLKSSPANYQDESGRYLVSITNLIADQAISGKLKVVELIDAESRVETEIYVDEQSNASVNIIEFPLSNFRKSLESSDGLNKYNQVPASRYSTEMDGDYPLSEIESMSSINVPPTDGSVLNDKLNVFTTRIPFLYPVDSIVPGEKKYKVSVSEKVFAFLSSCKTAKECKTFDKSPVILLHGYTPSGLGGKGGTWNDLPRALIDKGHAVFEMQWLTNMRFEEAAGALALFSMAVADATERKPIIVAHSFGGIVSHLALQGKGIVFSGDMQGRWVNVPSKLDKVIDRLITLSSPLSGISDEAVLNTNVSNAGAVRSFTTGRYYNDIFINACAAVTCLQAGAFDINSFERNTLNEKVSFIDPEKRLTGHGTSIYPGESIASIQTGVTPVPFLTVAAFGGRPLDHFTPDLTPLTAYKLGDGLISLIGQAFSEHDFAKSPYDISNNFRFKFIEDERDLEKLDKLGLDSDGKPTDPCMSYIADTDRNYLICAMGKHTNAHRNYNDDYGISYYEDDSPDFIHPLKGIISNAQWLGKESLIYVGVDKLRSDFFGKTHFYDKQGVKKYIDGVPVEVGLYSKVSGSKVSTSLFYTSNDGVFSVNIGSLIYAVLQPETVANISDFEVEIKIGDGVKYRVHKERIKQLSVSNSLGDIELIGFDTPVTNADAEILDSDIPSAKVTGATIYLEKGINLPPARLKQTSNSRISRVLTSDLNGTFRIDSIEPGIYSIFIEKMGFDSAYAGMVSLNGSPLVFSMKRPENDDSHRLLGVTLVGQGTVESTDASISCSTNCTRRLKKGTTLELIASPTDGYNFDGWEGSCSGSVNRCHVLLNDDTRVIANFSKQSDATLTIQRSGRGRVTGGAIDCGTSCSQTVTPGTRINLQAQPFSGAKFASWGGACAAAGTATSCSVLVEQSMTVSAEFLSPELLVSPVSLSFADVAIGSDKTLELLLRNTGNAELTGLSVNINSGEFVLGSAAPNRLAPGAEVKLPIVFTPEAEVESKAAVTISSTEWQTIAVPLSGKGTAVDLLFRLVPSRTDLTTGETVQLLVDLTSGNPPYRLKVNWGDGNTDEQQTSESSYSFSHAYSAEGEWPVTVTITDVAERTGSKTLNLKVSNEVTGQSRWSAQARHLITDEFASDIAINVSNAQIGNDTVQKYQTNWLPKAGSNNEYFVKYRLPVPSGYIKLANKFRMTAVFAASDISSYDRELGFVTDKAEYSAAWIHEVDPPIPGYLRVRPFSGTEQLYQSGLLNDDVFRTPIQTYAIEWQGGEFKAQRYKDGNYSPLEKLASTSNSLNELTISFKGNGSIYLVRLDYDLDGNGEYDDGHIIANTADLQVDWQLYKPEPVTGGSGKLNDTGISWCANGSQNGLDCPVPGFEGQDGEHGRDALAREGKLQKVGGGDAGFDFTKLDASGNDLPASATAWSCVRDNHTGLIWEVKTDDGGLRDKDHTYTWYNPDNSSNGGFAGYQNGGSCQGSECDTHSYVPAVNSVGLCGASDWRMPTKLELMGIVHNGRVSPAIDTGYFPNTLATLYWSSSANAGFGTFAWIVEFNSGGVYGWGMYGSQPLRLVRFGQ